jgi:uncharacterized protein (TIGR03437 family)
LLPILLATAAWAPAQVPSISTDGVANSASYLPFCAPNGAIAQGSIFVIFGEGLGPSSLVTASRFPLATTLSGTAVRVNVSGVTVDALPIYTAARQVAALLPSRTPVGMGTVTVSYQGRSSPAAPIRIARSAFGIYTLNQGGTGGAVGQIADGASNPVSTTARPIRAGQFMILWGTGLGPVTPDEAAGPLPNEPRDIRANVWVSDKQARVTYQGRSGCCAGIDQINFEIPAGVEGCNVPVAVEVGGVYSNYATIPIAAPGAAACEAPAVAPPQANPNFSLGTFGIWDLEFAIPGIPITNVRQASADFQRVRANSSEAALVKVFADVIATTPAIPAGSCMINPPAVPIDFVTEPSGASVALDAGPQLMMSGPGGARFLSQDSPGSHSLTIPDGFLTAGQYRISNANGGRDVGPFNFTLDYSAAKLTTLLSNIPRNQDLTLQWTVPPNPQGLVAISGSSVGACGRKEVSFSCLANTSAGRITIPSRILNQLPPSEAGTLLTPGGSVYFGPWLGNSQRRFDAKGLDLGFAFIFSAQIRSVRFQ